MPRRAVVSTVILPEDLAAKRCASPCMLVAHLTWRSDSSLVCSPDARTLPGVVPAVGFWDPLGFTDGQARP
jgi:hypothetical protein